MLRKRKKTLVYFLTFTAITVAFATSLIIVSVKKNSQPDCACGNPNLGEVYDANNKIAFFEGKTINVPEISQSQVAASSTAVLGESTQERWIEIDLSDQKLYAWEGNSLYLETSVSTGLPGYDTPQGTFYIWIKLRSTKMEGGLGRLYYYLPNVPYVMFFENDIVPGYRGYGLHGTYWHNDFGRVHSHGCVNLPTPIAEKLYYWTSPVIPSGKTWVRVDENNPGTRIVVHQ